ncbi:MAG: sugar ABC transporter ATP-binding protein [Alkalispirochaetaceae bacterium]
MAEEDVLLRVDGVSKSYGGLQALKSVSLEVRKGEVHAVVGENGAGKSTLMKILGGIVERDEGNILFGGENVVFNNPLESMNAGISIIHQELSMLPSLNVIENVFTGRIKSRRGVIPWKELEAETRKTLKRVGLRVDPHAILDTLSISHRQLIEIAKALSIAARLIIMDEPNSSLTESETERLFEVIENLQRQGISVIYVSHKIEEVLRISDRITVLRDGNYVGTLERAEATVDKVVQMMVGRELMRERGRQHEIGKERLRVRRLTGERFADVSFDLREGEILGFSGLVGAGRSEVLRGVFGADQIESGELEYEGKNVVFRTPQEAIRNGIAMVPEDRKKLSLFMGMPIHFNVGIANLPRMRKPSGLIDYERVYALVQRFVDQLNIKLGSMEYPVSSLSGGNQQKTVLARWLATEPRVLILDEPTHGVDVGAKAEIYHIIRELAAAGISIVLISSELPEIIAMSDRVVVMHEGRVTGILDRERLSEELIMSCATGTMDQESVTRYPELFGTPTPA